MRRHITVRLWYGRRMSRPDLNLLITLDVLLTEGSVARAAQRLRLSPSAMSRALTRLRHAVGDPLLVRAGRGLVPTPRAVELRGPVHQLAEEAQAILRPAEKLNLVGLARTFTLRTSEGFVENFGPDLIARVGKEAPGVRLHFLQKANKDSAPLRDGTVDLETGVVDRTTAQELRVQSLFRDRLIGVVRMGHPLTKGKMTPSRYAAGRHICVSRQRLEKGDNFRPQATVSDKVGDYRSRPAVVRLLPFEPDVPPRDPPIRFRKSIPTSWVELTLTEGKNRQVRRMTAAVGFPTLRLIRIASGPLKLEGLMPGQWRNLTAAEFAKLKAACKER